MGRLKKLLPLTDELRVGFIIYEKKRGIKNMKKSIASCLYRFFDYVNERQLDIFTIGIGEAKAYSQYLGNVQKINNKQLTKGTIKQLIQIAKRFYNYLVSTGKATNNPFAQLEASQGRGEEKKAAANWQHYHVNGFIEDQIKSGVRVMAVIRQSLKKLVVYFQRHGLAPEELKAQEYFDWIKELRMSTGKKYKTWSRLQFINTAIKYYDYLVKQGLVSINPLLVLKKQRRKKEVDKKYEALSEGFKNYLLLSGKRQRTIESFLINLPALFKYLEEKGLSFMELKAAAAQEFQGWIIECGESKQGFYAEGTVVGYITMAVNFFDYLKSKKMIYSNPFRDIHRVKEKRKLPNDVLKEDEMNRLLKVFAAFDLEKNLQSGKRAYRMHVLAELMYATGMRANEAANICLPDIDFAAATIRLRETKEKRERIVFLNDYAKAVLKIYVEEMRPWLLSVKADKAKLFGFSGRTLKNLFNLVLAKNCWKAQLVNVSSKGFRHAFGYHFLRAGCDMRFIQALLGHAQLTSTEKYTRVDKESLRDVVDKYHPRKWRKEK